MEFNEKLQQLRKNKGLTQEELSQEIFVSRTAVSKWESGRGYPNIDSLKGLAKFFSVTVDELISPDEIISAAEDEKQELIGRYTSLLCNTFVYPNIRQRYANPAYGIIVCDQRFFAMDQARVRNRHSNNSFERLLRNDFQPL